MLIFIFYYENHTVEINYYTVPAGNPAVVRPFRIVHITDLHVCSWNKPSNLARIVEIINGVKPDYVLMTGDYVSHYRELIPGCAKMLSGLKPIKKVIGTSGNHDWWVDCEYMSACLEKNGVIMLSNKFLRENDNEADLCFIGIDDIYTGHDNIEKTFRDVPKNSYKILLSHSPDVIETAKEKNIDIVLAGHTHGGQVRLPIIGAVYIPSKYGRKYAQGWFNDGNTKMFVNRGLGSIFPPIRFLCKKEIVVMEIVPGNGDVRTDRKRIVNL